MAYRVNGHNPYCVWFDCKIRTFRTLERAQSFARKTRGRIGEWSEAERWWVDRDVTFTPFSFGAVVRPK